MAGTKTGGAGSDSFTVTATSEADVVLDFQDGQDLIGLVEGLAFADLEITQGTGENANDVIIEDTLQGNVLLVIENVNVDSIDDTDFIDVALPEEPIPPTPTPTPTSIPTPTPTDNGPSIVGAEVLVANSSTRIGDLAQLTGTGASSFTINNATGNTGQEVSADFEIQGSNLRRNLGLVNSSVLASGISGNSSVNLTIASQDAEGGTLGTTQFTVYRDIDDAIRDSAIGDGDDISDGTGQDTVLVASGTYDDENLPSNSTTTLKFSSLNQFTLIPMTCPKLLGISMGYLWVPLALTT
ncbi:MAG: hypothetical protein GDA48_25070 [Hormoscilla sp. GM102CHS1]|nr:hypothetical protein [Hormoscilla sp. GM102CHS1]